MKLQHYSISLQPTVVLFNQIERTISSYSKALKSRLLSSKNIHKSYNILSAIRDLLLLVGLLGSISVVVYQIYNKEATIGNLALLVLYQGQITAPLRFFVMLGCRINQQITKLDRLVNILHRLSSTADTAGAQPLQFLSGKVEFQGVGFDYNGKKSVLDNFNLFVPSGHTVAFVGPSGAGKSTILSLLMQQHLSQKGSIFIDGQNIRHVTQHRYIRVVPHPISSRTPGPL